MLDLVPAIDPDVLVACVTEIDRLHTSKGYTAAMPDVMVVGVRRHIRNTETAVAALERIQALVEALADYPAILAHYPASSTIPDPLTRAAAVTPLERVAAIGAVFEPKALQEAALALRDAGGRA